MAQRHFCPLGYRGTNNTRIKGSVGSRESEKFMFDHSLSGILYLDVFIAFKNFVPLRLCAFVPLCLSPYPSLTSAPELEGIQQLRPSGSSICHHAPRSSNRINSVPAWRGFSKLGW